MTMQSKKRWQVDFSGHANKQKGKLPEAMQEVLDLLRWELETDGPVRNNWPNYGKIKGKGKNIDMHHCHLNKGRPCYVAVWVVTDKEVQILEVRHVGTHEKTDYRRIH